MLAVTRNNTADMQNQVRKAIHDANKRGKLLLLRCNREIVKKKNTITISQKKKKNN